jgi:hypothetical protein
MKLMQLMKLSLSLFLWRTLNLRQKLSIETVVSPLPSYHLFGIHGSCSEFKY